MKVKLDENMPELAAAYLRSQGCDVHTIVSEKLSGSPDPIVVAAAKAEGRVLITFDKGIANLQNPDYANHCGVILLRLTHPNARAALALLQAHFPALSQQPLAGKIVVISSSGIRIR